MRFVLVAGEASGDQIGAPLIEALRQLQPDAEFAGIGGPKMAAAGLDCWWSSDELAVMGIVEVLRHLPRLLRLRRNLLQRVDQFSPDCYIGIDAPDFNLGVERRLKQAGARTVHYVSPSIWAWRRKRAKKIGQAADRVLCLFPFEPELYRDYGVDARFVGHPLADQTGLAADSAQARQRLKLPPNGPLIAVLPGSRQTELNRLGPGFAGAVAELAKQRPELQFVSVAPSELARAMFAEELKLHRMEDQVSQFVGQVRDVLQAADLVLLASGTATLEVLLARKPMVVGYKVAPLSYRLVRMLGMLKVEHFSLPNALTSEPLVPELMQENFTSESLAEATLSLLDDSRRAQKMTSEFGKIHQQLRCDSAAQAAVAVLEVARQ